MFLRQLGKKWDELERNQVAFKCSNCYENTFLVISAFLPVFMLSLSSCGIQNLVFKGKNMLLQSKGKKVVTFFIPLNLFYHKICYEVFRLHYLVTFSIFWFSLIRAFVFKQPSKSSLPQSLKYALHSILRSWFNGAWIII